MQCDSVLIIPIHKITKKRKNNINLNRDDFGRFFLSPCESDTFNFDILRRILGLSITILSLYCRPTVEYRRPDSIQSARGHFPQFSDGSVRVKWPRARMLSTITLLECAFLPENQMQSHENWMKIVSQSLLQTVPTYFPRVLMSV